MVSSIIIGIKILILICISILCVQSIFCMHKFYKFAAYKNAEIASEKYLESRLLVGINGKDVSKIAKQLDEYLNDVLGVDLNEDELICIVESKIWRTISENKKHNKNIKAANMIAEGLRNNIINYDCSFDRDVEPSVNKSTDYVKVQNQERVYKDDDIEIVAYNEILGGVSNDD